MPLVQFEHPKYVTLPFGGPPKPPDIVRGYALAFPLDWEAVLADRGPLPVVVVFHGGGQQPVDFIANSLKVGDWWTGKWAVQSAAGEGARIKAIVIAPMGVSMNDDLGGDWNAGNMGQLNRDSLIDDEAFVFEVLELAEKWFQDALHYRAWKAWIDSGEQIFFGWWPQPVFDRGRISFVGFSQGGQMAYRMANKARYQGWSVRGLGVFSSSIGGWYRESDRDVPVPPPPDVDWSPTFTAGPMAGTRVASLLHIHGDADPSAPCIDDGPSISVATEATLQVVDFNPLDFMRSDICGANSAQRYADALTGSFGPPAAAAPPFPVPAAAANLVFGQMSSSFAAEWTVAGEPRRVFFARVGGMDHQVPLWGPEALVNFFLAEGGL